jgi:hypothetical protein
VTTLSAEKDLSQSLTGLLQVLCWRLSNEITQDEFHKLYTEWQKRAGLLQAPVMTRPRYLTNLGSEGLQRAMLTEIASETGWVREVARKYRCSIEGVIKMMGQLLNSEFNHTITEIHTQSLGRDTTGEIIAPVNQSWV